MRNPWDINPLLNREHLIEIAQFIAEVRGEVVDRHDPDGLGDTKRGLGMRVYECSRERLIREAAFNNKSWLGILTKEKRFTFSINSVPVRFYRGHPKTPEERRLIPSIEAMYQQSLLPIEEPVASVLWFFAVETDSDHYADKITFSGFNPDTRDCICSWEVPLQDSVQTRPAAVGEKVEPVAKPEVTIRVKTKTADKRKNG